MANDIAFRRVRGRVVPIHLSREQQNKAKGGAGVVAGLGVSVAAGRLAGGFVRDAAHAEEAARGSGNMAKGMLHIRKDLQGLGATKNHLGKVSRQVYQHRRAAAKSTAMANTLFQNAKNVRRLGFVSGGGLIAGGVDKLLPEKTKKNTKVRAAIDTGVAAGSAFAIRSAYYYPLQKAGIWKALKFAASRMKVRGLKL